MDLLACWPLSTGGEGDTGDAGPEDRSQVAAPETGYHNDTARYHRSATRARQHVWYSVAAGVFSCIVALDDTGAPGSNLRAANWISMTTPTASESKTVGGGGGQMMKKKEMDGDGADEGGWGGRVPETETEAKQ